MKNYLSVYFGENRTFFCVTEKTAKGIELKYEFSSKLLPNFDENDFSDGGFNYDFDEIIKAIGYDIVGIIPVVPYSQIFTSLMPKPEISNNEELRKLFKFELRMNFPEKVYEDFSAYCVPLNSNKNSGSYILGLAIKNKVIEECKNFLSPFSLPISDIVFPQTSTVLAYCFNYPENVGKISVLVYFGVCYASITICRSTEILFYTELNFDNHLGIIKVLQYELEKARGIIKDDLHYLMLYGEALTPSILEEYKNYFKNGFSTVSRLNAFRMMTTKLGNEYREYCNKMAHVFPSCVGALSDESIEIIKVF